jgi:hypothetical protein
VTSLQQLLLADFVFGGATIVRRDTMRLVYHKAVKPAEGDEMLKTIRFRQMKTNKANVELMMVVNPMKTLAYFVFLL